MSSNSSRSCGFVENMSQTSRTAGQGCGKPLGRSDRIIHIFHEADVNRAEFYGSKHDNPQKKDVFYILFRMLSTIVLTRMLLFIISSIFLQACKTVVWSFLLNAYPIC